MSFNKGTTVHFITSWNHAAQIVVRKGKVFSCGAKQMILVDDAGVKFGGRNFLPQQQQYGFGRVFANLNDGQAECIAEAMCEEVRLIEIERCERAIANVRAHAPMGGEGYVLSMQYSISELKADEAKVIWL